MDELLRDDEKGGSKDDSELAKKGPKRQQKRRGRPRKAVVGTVGPTGKGPTKKKQTGVKVKPQMKEVIPVVAIPLRRSPRIAVRTGIT